MRIYAKWDTLRACLRLWLTQPAAVQRERLLALKTAHMRTPDQSTPVIMITPDSSKAD